MTWPLPFGYLINRNAQFLTYSVFYHSYRKLVILWAYIQSRKKRNTFITIGLQWNRTLSRDWFDLQSPRIPNLLFLDSFIGLRGSDTLCRCFRPTYWPTRLVCQSSWSNRMTSGDTVKKAMYYPVVTNVFVLKLFVLY